jgi:hypothetical protein
VTFSDFVFGLDIIGLTSFDRHLSLLIFNYLDRDHDHNLVYNDFVRLVEDAADGFSKLPEIFKEITTHVP